MDVTVTVLPVVKPGPIDVPEPGLNDPVRARLFRRRSGRATRVRPAGV